jgi:hypothetical protein
MAIIINSTIVQEGAYGEDTIYGVNATESSSKSILYRWQISEDGGIIWSDLSLWQAINFSNFILFSNNIISISQSFKDIYPNFIWRVVLSAPGELDVISSSFGQYDPVNINIISGNGEFENNVYRFRILATARLSDDMFLDPKIRWQKSTNEGISWENISEENLEEGNYFPNENLLIIAFSTNVNIRMKVRAAVTAPGAFPVFSNPSDIFYNGSGQPQANLSVIFTGSSIDTQGNTVHSVIGSSSDGAEVFYQWQYTEINDPNWLNIVSSSSTSGVTTSNLRLSPNYIDQNPNFIYRCVLSSISSGLVYSRIFGLEEIGLQINLVYSGGLNNSAPSDSIGGPPSSNFIIGSANNLFSDVSREDSGSGVIDYRCFYITNDSQNGESLYQTSIYVQSEYNSQSSVQIGISRRSEVQVLSLLSTPTSGSFKLNINGLITSPILWSSDSNIFQNNIKSAINDLNGIEVLVQRTFLNNYEISFIGESNNRNYELITASENTLFPLTLIQLEKTTEGQPVNSIAPRIFNSKSPPFNVIFLQTNFNNRIFIGDMNPGDIVPIWIRRYTYAEVSADQLNGFNLRITGNKNKSSIVLAEPVEMQSSDKPNFYFGE